MLLLKDTRELSVTQLAPEFNLGRRLYQGTWDNGAYVIYGPFPNEESGLNVCEDLLKLDPKLLRALEK